MIRRFLYDDCSYRCFLQLLDKRHFFNRRCIDNQCPALYSAFHQKTKDFSLKGA
jgi:hypothetical protein